MKSRGEVADIDQAVQAARWALEAADMGVALQPVMGLLVAAVHSRAAGVDGVLRVRLLHHDTGLYLFEVLGDGSARVFVRRGPVPVFPAGTFPAPVAAGADSAGRPGPVRRGRGDAAGALGSVPGCVGCGAVLAWGAVACGGCGFPVPVLVAAHPGAGVSVLAKATGFRDASVPTEVLPPAGAAQLLLVARMHANGLDTARRLLGEHREDGRFAVLLLVPDAPGKLPKPLADQVGVIAAAFPVLRVPWVEAWRWAPGARTATFTRFFPTLATHLVSTRPPAGRDES